MVTPLELQHNVSVAHERVYRLPKVIEVPQ